MSTPESTATPEREPKKRRRWLLPTAVGVVALMIGYAAGSGDEDDTAAASDDTDELQTELDDLTAERDALQEQLDADDDGDEGGSADAEKLDARGAELDERESTLNEREGELDDREEAVAAMEAAAESDDGGEQDDASEESSDNSDPGESDDGSHSAGSYSFSDVQVYEDGLGDFALRSRVTNTGSDQSGVIWTATLFNGGSVVGTLSGTAQDFSAEDTVTVEFFSTDAFGDWDEIEFQVDTQF